MIVLLTYPPIASKLAGKMMAASDKSFVEWLGAGISQMEGEPYHLGG